MAESETELRQAPYLIFIFVLSILALGALLAQRALALSPEELRVLEIFDWAVCLVFLADFVVTLAQSKNRLKYLATWGWLDLISSIPAAAAFRWARSARIVRIIKLLRAIRAARLLTRTMSLRRAQGSMVTASIVGTIVLVFSSVAILQVEVGDGANIKTAEDAIWWTLTTMTTVGYGDRYPVTSEGRVVGAGLMIVGVGLFGILTAFLASLFVKSEETRVEREVGELRKEFAEVKLLLRELGRASEGGRSPDS